MTEKAERRLTAIPGATVSAAEGRAFPEIMATVIKFIVNFFGSNSD